MSELKACPVCGKPAKMSHELSIDDHVSCANFDCLLYGLGFHIEVWNARPLEDELNKRITELEAEIEALREHKSLVLGNPLNIIKQLEAENAALREEIEDYRAGLMASGNIEESN